MSINKQSNEDSNSSSKRPLVEKKKVGLLGCTGTVGQRFIQLLEDHPHFEIACIGASSRSSGKTYEQVVAWKLSTPIPSKIRTITIVECVPNEFKGCVIIFSGLDASVAGEVEENFAKQGYAVFSNAKNHRMNPLVPILIPSVNPDHLNIVTAQRKKYNYPGKGCIITNANCSTTGLTVALKPIHDHFQIKKCIVFTMQAVSGAGYPGVPSLDILDNVIPYISGEEEKITAEAKKILGTLDESKTALIDADIRVSAHCNRVNVLDGHTECVSLKLGKKASPSEVEEVLKKYVPNHFHDLHSAPKKPIDVTSSQDRPQPRLDRDSGGGNTVTVGRVREDSVLDIKLVLLSHNTIIGAAGGSILNAELALHRGFI
eukprot:TRINITY_DN7297_c0_g1_i4.p1 TRINITY_DN7297_c0_g1~~TRINITY_DN7297_c0_g1_i4.p1  ORF type:complete len:373 (-),score=66.08 TRINITY_DN7297_c0_g1_i4:72-1190(-)